MTKFLKFLEWYKKMVRRSYPGRNAKNDQILTIIIVNNCTLPNRTNLVEKNTKRYDMWPLNCFLNKSLGMMPVNFILFYVPIACKQDGNTVTKCIQ